MANGKTRHNRNTQKKGSLENRSKHVITRKWRRECYSRGPHSIVCIELNKLTDFEYTVLPLEKTRDRRGPQFSALGVRTNSYFPRLK